MEIAPSVVVTITIFTFSSLIAFIVWLIRLESVSKNNESNSRRNESELSELRKQFDSYRLSEATYLERLNTMARDIQEIKANVRELTKNGK